MTEELRPAELAELDRSTCFVLLASQKVGRLVVAGTDPFVAPVNYVLDEEGIVFRADKDSPGGRVCGAVVFEVDALDDDQQSGWSVVVRGEVEDITGAVDPSLRERLQPWAPGPKDRWLRLHVREMTGRSLRGAEQPAPDRPRGYL